jgi:hypothetical protein
MNRKENLIQLGLFPVRLACFVVGMVYMFATAPLVIVVVIFVLGPAEVCLFLSIFVGVIHPATGTRMSRLMEPASDIAGNFIDWIWTPGMLLFDKTL